MTLLEIDIDLRLRGSHAEKMVAEAARRGRPPAAVLADVIEAVIEDDLFAAVLDR